MYTIHVDGNLLFSTAQMDAEHTVLEPKLVLDVNGAGSLTFVIPPCNHLHGSIQRIKSVVIVRQDGDILFRGRVTSAERDIYGQDSIYCEGDLSFLMDSQSAPYTYTGTVRGLFNKLITEHNAQVDAGKRFTIGSVTAVDADEELPVEVECEEYWQTRREIQEKLLDAYGGYLRTRTVGNVTYIDWLREYGGTNTQAIEFSVNLLDLQDKIDAADVFTILIPLGYADTDDEGNPMPPVDITSVNGGVKYIQDDDAVAMYGKIWKAKTWPYEEDPAKLLEKGREYLRTGAAIETLTLNAIDMHFADGSIQRIGLGDKVHILSEPHGIDMTIICAQMDIDLLNPEYTTYTFGEPPKTLTEHVTRNSEDIEPLSGRGGGGGGIKEEVGRLRRWANLQVDEKEAKISMLAGESYEDIDGTVSLKQANILINGAAAKISMLAGEEYDRIDGSYSLRQASIDIAGAEAAILLKANATDVEALDGRVTQAEASITINADQITSKVSKNGVISAINQTAESIKIQAAKINLEGYVTTDMLASDAITIRTLNVTGATSTDSLNVSNLASIGSLRVENHNISLKEVTVLTSSTSLSVTSTGGTVTGVTLNKRTDTLYYMAWG